MSAPRREVSATTWSTIIGLAFTAVGGLCGFALASYQAGKQLAVLDDIKPALLQLQAHETRLAVIEESCCTERPKRATAVEAAPTAWWVTTCNPSSVRLHTGPHRPSWRITPAPAPSSHPLFEAALRTSVLAGR